MIWHKGTVGWIDQAVPSTVFSKIICEDNNNYSFVVIYTPEIPLSHLQM